MYHNYLSKVQKFLNIFFLIIANFINFFFSLFIFFLSIIHTASFKISISKISKSLLIKTGVEDVIFPIFWSLCIKFLIFFIGNIIGCILVYLLII
nr:hypothetical protein CcurKRNrm2_p102 [Cryptomonas curvata]